MLLPRLFDHPSVEEVLGIDLQEPRVASNDHLPLALEHVTPFVRERTGEPVAV